jgi:protein-L-isoaspartate(D-aspartate) O-methyltransferase
MVCLDTPISGDIPMTLPLNAPADQRDPVTQARYNMIEQQIRPWNVLKPEVLELLGIARREAFVPPEHSALAFMDIEIPLKGTPEQIVRNGWCMLAPRVEARMLHDLDVRATDRVLEIGAGSGFMASLLASAAKEVVTVEIDAELAEMARENLLSANVTNAQVVHGDGSQAGTVKGSFDVIVLSGSVAQVPQALLDLLNDGGRLAAIVGEEPVMRATFVRREGSQFHTTQPWDTIAPRLSGFAQPSRFQF